MHTADDSPDGVVYSHADQLRHDLKTPLTTIHARAQLVGRAIRRVPSLTDEERGKMLAGVAAIEAAMRTVVITIDGLSGKGADPP